MKITRLHHAYNFPGYRAKATVREYPDRQGAVIVALKRTYEKKDQNALTVVPETPTGMTERANRSGTSTVATSWCTLNSRYGASSARSVAS